MAIWVEFKWDYELIAYRLVRRGRANSLYFFKIAQGCAAPITKIIGTVPSTGGPRWGSDTLASSRTITQISALGDD